MNRYKKLLPQRQKTSNKSSGGNAMFIGGNQGFHGSILLASLAATTCGAGYTHLMSDVVKMDWLKFPDFILHPQKISELKNRAEFAFGVGPGLGFKSPTQALLNQLIRNDYDRVVLDADALTLLGKLAPMRLNENWILTPHEGELSKLLKIPIQSIKKNREKYLGLAVQQWGCVVILKGYETLVGIPGAKKLVKIKAGTTALSKAGTGDVLTGIITAFRAQGLSAKDAACLAVYIHGAAARLWLKETKADELSLRPTHLIEYLPKALKALRKS